ncbi:hypothetical protein H9P43_008681 [Blastocladiella emersonii ATCC 22665]|nr:hypothetical protein H9P43_008681 [Blastocladiella emersonii ATCC 22665]
MVVVLGIVSLGLGAELNKALNSPTALLTLRDRVAGVLRRSRNAAKFAFYGGGLLGIMAATNVMQVGAVLLRPIHAPTSSAIHTVGLGTVWGYIQYMLERHNRAPITYSGDVKRIPYHNVPAGRSAPSAFVIANHLFFCDFVLEHTVAIRRGVLGHCRYMSKDSHKWWPLFGWMMGLARFVFLKRNWHADHATIKARLAEWASEHQPIWLVVYPEGTRQTPAKLAAGQAFARDQGLPVLDHVLLPRTRGFTYIVDQLRNARNSQFEYVLDFTVAAYHVPTASFNRVFPTGYELFGEDMSRDWKFHVHVDMHRIADLPHDENALAGWLVDRWVEKDARLARWKEAWPEAAADTAVAEESERAYTLPWPWA